jgi:hypothetical protein
MGVSQPIRLTFPTQPPNQRVGVLKADLDLVDWQGEIK